MKKYQLLFPIFVAFFIGCSRKDPYQTERYFKKEEQTQIINQCVRHSAKLPPDATNETKFSPEFNWYYDVATAEYDFRRCYPLSDGGREYFFLLTRKARSVWPAREAIGGTLEIDDSNKLIGYAEVFRTWKMAEDTLNIRSFELFDLMVKGKDLTPYRSKFKGDRYIEFPDDRYNWNNKEKKWIDAVMDSIR